MNTEQQNESRAKIDCMFNGIAPYDEQQVKDLNIWVNVIDMEGNKNISKAVIIYKSVFSKHTNN